MHQNWSPLETRGLGFCPWPSSQSLARGILWDVTPQVLQPTGSAGPWVCSADLGKETRGDWAEHRMCLLESYSRPLPTAGTPSLLLFLQSTWSLFPGVPLGPLRASYPGNWDFFHKGYYSIRSQWYINSSLQVLNRGVSRGGNL